MNDELAKKRIQSKLSEDLEACHTAALRFIEKVTTYAQDQAHNEGITLDPYTITAEMIVDLASKHIGADYNELHQNYVDLMVLEKMIEFAPKYQSQ